MTGTIGKISPFLRIGSMLLDHITACLIMGVVMLPFLLFSIMNDFNSAPFASNLTSPSTDLLVMSAVFAIYFCKDSIDGRSIAKRFTRLQVVNAGSGEAAGSIRCCIRNLTIPIWPLEVIITFFSPTRRLGDIIAGTKTIAFDKTKDKSPANWLHILMAFVIGYSFTFLLFFLIFRLI